MCACQPDYGWFPAKPDPVTVAETLRRAAARLTDAGIDNPRLEARLLLAHAMQCSVEDLIRDPHAEASEIAGVVDRRAAHEPLALILGWREFWSLRFRVSPATLIPRPDSETVVEAALALFPDRMAPLRVLDLGTGTGCLLLAVLHERPRAWGVGLDRSEGATRLARANARTLGLGDRALFACGHWADSFNARFDLVLSNPPYIATAELGALMPEVAAHEPRTALDGGPDGLTAYRAIAGTLPDLLNSSGAAVLELGAGQLDAVSALGRAAGFRARSRSDLSGIARAIIFHPPP